MLTNAASRECGRIFNRLTKAEAMILRLYDLTEPNPGQTPEQTAKRLQEVRAEAFQFLEGTRP